MTYKPEPVINFPADPLREFVKIAAEFATQTRTVSIAMSDMEKRIQGLEAAAVPPEPAPSSDMLWRWAALDVTPFNIQARDTSRVSFFQVGGRNAVRLLTMPGDSWVAGSGAMERCDLRLGNAESDAKEGREWWFKHGVWFPDDYAELPMSPLNAQPWYVAAIFDWHDDADDGSSQGPIQLIEYPSTATSPDRNTGLVMEVYGGNWKPGDKPNGSFPVGPVVRNKWYDFVLHIRWTSTAGGFCDGWLNGKPFMAYVGPTLITGHGAYLKLANYHTAHGKPSALLHGPITMATTEAGLA